MKTLVLDHTGRITRFAPVHPFFYRQQATGDLVLFGNLRDHQFKRQADTLEIQRLLKKKGWHGKQWQLIALLPLAEDTSTDSMPSNGCRTDHIVQLTTEILSPLDKHGLSPVRTIVLFIDTVRRHSVTSEPFSPAEQQKFAIETTGYIHSTNKFDPFFTLADLNTFEKIWSHPVDLKGCSTDRGINGLPEQTREKLEEQCQKAVDTLGALVAEKIESLNHYTDKNSSIFFDEKIITSTHDRFTAELNEYTQNNIAAFKTYLPAEHLKKILFETFTVSGVIQNYKISILRFSMEENGKALGQMTIELSYLILCICEQGEELALSTDKALSAVVALDRKKLHSALAEFMGRLNAAKQGLTTQKRQIYDDKYCIEFLQECPGYEDLTTERCTSTPPANVSSQEKWIQVVEDNSAGFEKFQRKNESHLDTFRNRILNHGKKKTETIQNLKTKELELQQNKKQLMEDLLEDSYDDFTVPFREWKQKKKVLSEKAHFFFAENPSFFSRCLVFHFSCFLLAAPPLFFYLSTHPFSRFQEPIEYYYPLTILLLALTPMILLNFIDRHRLNQLISTLDKAIKRSESAFQRVFNNNMDVIYRLCSLLVNKQNSNAVLQKNEKILNRQIHIIFFLEQIARYEENINQLALDIPPPENEQKEYSDIEIRLFHPPEKQLPFWVSASSNKKITYTITNEGAEGQGSSADMPGLEQIIFAADGTTQ